MSENHELNDATLDEFLANDDAGPVVMLNLLRFKPVGGAATYATYLEGFGSSGVRERYGLEVVYAGTGLPALIAEGDAWDMVLLVRYPSRQHFVDMTRDPDYQAFAHLREQALDASVLQPTSPQLADAAETTP